jgi:hypothetical protein
MPKPTLQNRKAFKNYVRFFKKKFTSQIQNLSLSDIDSMLTQKTSGLGDIPIKFIIFDNFDVVDVSSLKASQSYLYLPGLEGDVITLQIDGNKYDLKFIGDDAGVKYNNVTYGLNSIINLSGAKLTVKGLGGALLQLQSAPTYSITSSTLIANEGDSITFNITTTDVSNGTYLYYTTSGTTTAADFTDGLLTGQTTVNNNSASITRTLLNDFTIVNQEDIEYFLLQLRLDSISGQVIATSSGVIINDSSTASYSLSVSSNSVIEGGLLSFTLNTTGVPSGTTLYYTLEGQTSSYDFTLGSTGSFITTSNSTSIDIFVTADLVSEGSETFTLKIRTGSLTGPIVATSSSITIQDLIPTASINVNSLLVDENDGSLLTCVVTTTNVPNGSILFYTTTGTTNSNDFSNGSGSFVVNNNTSSFYIIPRRDGVTEGNEVFAVQIRSGSTNGQILATSNAVTLVDSSYIGSKKTNLTFGPIRVNRDNGNEADVSDWYTICGLDKIPDDSKIALFIDQSGSMTLSTVQASYNLLMSKLADRNINVLVITNGNEDWISSFDTFLD